MPAPGWGARSAAPRFIVFYDMYSCYEDISEVSNFVRGHSWRTLRESITVRGTHHEALQRGRAQYKNMITQVIQLDSTS